MQHLGLPQPVDPDSIPIQRHRQAGHPGSLVDLPDLPIARILHPVTLVPAQKLNQQIIQKVRARSHQNLIRRDGHGAESIQIIRNGLAEHIGASRRHRPQKLRSVVQKHLPLKLGPDGKGKGLRRQVVGRKIRLPDRPWGLRQLQSPPVGRSLPLLHRFHKVTHLLLGADVSLRHQLGVGRFHRDLADFQMVRQRPFGGQLLPRHQSALQNIPPDAPIQRLIQGPCLPV